MAKLDVHARLGEFAQIDTDGSGSIELSEFVAHFKIHLGSFSAVQSTFEPSCQALF